MTKINTQHENLNEISFLKKEIKNLKQQIAFKDQIFDISPNYIILVGLEGEILEVNNSVREILFNGKDFIPHHFSQLDIIPSRDFHKYTDSINSILNGTPTKPFQSRFLSSGNESENETRSVKVHISPVKSGEMINAISIFAMDTTLQDILEDSLHESISLQKATLESTTDGIVVINSQGKITSFNQKFLEMWNIPKNLVDSGKDVKIREHVMEQLIDPLHFQEKMEDLYLNPKDISRDTLELKDGQIFQRYSQPHIMGSQVVGRIWSFRDHTHLKNTEKSLKESETYYKTLFEHSGTATLIVEEDNLISLVNSETENIFGYKPEEVMGQKTWLEFVKPEYHGQMMEYQKLRHDTKNTAPDQYEFRLIDKNGEVKDIFANVCLIPGTGRTLASILDVTERNKALDKIKESENRYRTLAEAVEEFVFIFDHEDRLEYINQYAADRLKVESSQLLGKQRRELVARKTYQLQSKYFERVFEKGDSIRREMELPLPHESLWLDSMLIPLKNQEGIVEKVLVVSRDITDRKKHELLINRQYKILKCMGTILSKAITSEKEDELTKTSLNMCKDITESKFGFICEININKEFETLAVSESVLEREYPEDIDIYPMLQELKTNETWNQLKQTKAPIIINQSLNPDENFLPENHPLLENFMIVPLLRDGEFMGMIGLANKESGYDSSDAQDIETISTTIVETIMRKRAEQKLKTALKDKEMLVREIHHRTKNNLMIMASLLSLTSSDIKDEHARQIFKQIQTRTKSMALIHEKLYQSKESKQINFGDYIRYLAQDLFKSFLEDPDQVQLVMELEDLNLDINTAIPLGLILNELLTNSMKYAFPHGESGNIFIKFYKEGDDYIMMVNDDGVGLPTDLDINKTDTLGLQLVKSLIGQIDGEVMVNQESGTHITIKFQEEDFTS